MNSAIELKDVKKTYLLGEVEVPVLRGMSLDIKKGEFASIVGPSGSGKTTLLNLIGCLDVPTSGRVLIDGSDISEYSEDELALIRRQKIGFVFQQFNLIAKLTALENVKFPMWLKNVPADVREKRATEILTSVGLGHRMTHKPAELSGGERQRVSIARSLANKPEIILADEPTGNLDTVTGHEVVELLTELQKKQDLTLIIVTHDTSLAKKARRAIHIRDGMIVKGGKK